VFGIQRGSLKPLWQLIVHGPGVPPSGVWNETRWKGVSLMCALWM
jgi:hypothetical protein